MSYSWWGMMCSIAAIYFAVECILRVTTQSVFTSLPIIKWRSILTDGEAALCAGLCLLAVVGGGLR